MWIKFPVKYGCSGTPDVKHCELLSNQKVGLKKGSIMLPVTGKSGKFSVN